jgi:probable rRNA maturation factor
MILSSEGAPDAEVNVLLADDATLHALNRTYLREDRPTDVLSFSQREELPGAPATPRVEGQAAILGDVVISVETAARQAAERSVSLESELALLTVHGILHLLGYDDSTEPGAEQMRLRERAALQAMKL